ncbi:hypothetical protein DZF91_05075, partial [Actinomadura logoneensis]
MALVLVQAFVWTLPAVSAVLARVLDPGFPGVPDGLGRGVLAAVSTGVAAGALAARRIAPGWAFGGALAAGLMALCTGGAAMVWPFVLVVALFSLAVHRTAGVAAAGAATTALTAAELTAVAGAPLRTATGAGLLAAGGTAVVWVLGRA